MNPQNGVPPLSEPIPPQLLVLIVFFAVLVIGAFSFAMTAFLRAGGSDARTRRKRPGTNVKDPLDPEFVTDAGNRDTGIDPAKREDD